MQRWWSKLTQSGQDDARGPALAHWPEELRQERVGADGGHAGLAQVGAGLIAEGEELLELLHRLQREAPVSDLDKRSKEAPKSQSSQPKDVGTKTLIQKERVNQKGNSAHLDVHGCRAAHTQQQRQQDAGSSHGELIQVPPQPPSAPPAPTLLLITCWPSDQ